MRRTLGALTAQVIDGVLDPALVLLVWVLLSHLPEPLVGVAADIDIEAQPLAALPPGCLPCWS